MKVNTDVLMYRRQMIEFAEQSKLSITIPANIVENETSDSVLGKIVRVMYEEKLKEAEQRIAYLKNQE